MIYSLQNKKPHIHDSAYIAPGAHVMGDVTIGEQSSIWFNSVIRGDEAPIKIGKKCNIQDNSTCHLYEESPLRLEDEVRVRHNVILHGCTLKEGALSGMGEIILAGSISREKAGT